MSRQLISKLAEVDPTFVQMCKSLYGDSMDPRELWDTVAKAMPDQSSINTGNQKRRRALGGGLALGVAAETAGTVRAGQTAVKAYKHPVVPKIPKSPAASGLKGTLKALSHSPHGKAGEFGLQAVNLGVGIAASRELLKKPKGNQQKSVTMSKGVAAKAVRYTASPAAIAHSQKTAKSAQKMLVGAAAVGGAAGGYTATKKYHLKRVPPQSAVAVKPTKMAVKKRAEMDFTWEGTISKVDTDKRLVFGWCSLSKVNGEPVVDLQGDYIPIEETENSAYRYVVESRKGGDMHRRVSKFDQDQPLHTADLVESMVFTPEKLAKMGLPEDAIPHGWWIGMKVNDEEQWQNVKLGKRLGFSIHGTGKRVEKSI